MTPDVDANGDENNRHLPTILIYFAVYLLTHTGFDAWPDATFLANGSATQLTLAISDGFLHL